jgi:intracellular sulfur oxidation DsrE/DsrF family protein
MLHLKAKGGRTPGQALWRWLNESPRASDAALSKGLLRAMRTGVGERLVSGGGRREAKIRRPHSLNMTARCSYYFDANSCAATYLTIFSNGGFSFMNNSDQTKKRSLSILAGLLVALSFGAAQAEGKRCLVVHVPQDDPKALKQAVNIASNIPKQLGVDNVTVEVVAQGPGLSLLTEGSPEGERIRSLITQSEDTLGGGTTFSACAATMQGIKQRTGKEPVLLEGVGVVHPGAVVRVMELQEQGCSYIRI